MNISVLTQTHNADQIKEEWLYRGWWDKDGFLEDFKTDIDQL